MKKDTAPLDIMKVNRPAIYLGFATFVILVLLIVTFNWSYEHDVNYHHVFTYPGYIRSIEGWDMVQPGGYYNIDAFAERYEEITGEALPSRIDTEGKAYVITYGYTLERLTYRTGAGEKYYDLPTYYAKAYLKKAQPALYIYEVDENEFYIEQEPHTNYADDTVIIG